MTPTKLLAVAAIGLSAAACSYSNTTTATAPPPAVVAPAGTVVVASSSQQACVDYGFTPGTASYDRCVRLEADARRRALRRQVGKLMPGSRHESSLGVRCQRVRENLQMFTTPVGSADSCRQLLSYWTTA